MLNSLLDLPGLRVDHLSISAETIIITAYPTSSSAPCPDCGTLSSRIHSYYTRSLRDLPWGSRALRVTLDLRRFRCRQPECPRQTFVERLPDIAGSYARTTSRFRDRQELFGLALGGEVGARLTAKMCLATSPDTLIRRIRAAPLPAFSAPTTIGIDDWAKRRGHSYGTIIVDLETRRPIDLLPERTAEVVATWLQAQPTVAVISRDRAGAYADAARRGAPQARQIVDRFHLLVNLRTTVQDILQQHSKSLRYPSGQTADNVQQNIAASVEQLELEPLTDSSTCLQLMEQQRHQRRAQRHAQYDLMLRYWSEGWSQAQIAATIGVTTRTVQRWLANPSLRERRPRPPTGSRLDRYRDFVIERWQEGCRSGAELYRELQKQGYRGSYRLVTHYLQQLFPPDADEQRRRCIRRQKPTKPICTPHEASWLYLRDRHTLSEEEHKTLKQVQAAHSELDALYKQVQQFRQVLHRREEGLFEAWVERIRAGSSAELLRFVEGLERDGEAVKAAMREEWSNGPVEGHVHRLKLIKRSMYGRAKFDLLRKRVLIAV